MVTMQKLEKQPKYKLDIEVEIGDKTISLNNKKSKLLKCIDTFGSIARASEETGIPYRTALKNIEIMEMEMGSPIVVTKRGGKGGGGSSELTKEGKEILFKFIKMNRVLRRHADLNELEGHISEINEDKKITKVALDKTEIIIPTLKNFKEGDKVLLTISPNDIFIILEPQESSVRNLIKGKITEMKFKNDKVRLMVDIGKENVVVDITELSRKELNLDLGKRVFIGFKAASIDMMKID